MDAPILTRREASGVPVPGQVMSMILSLTATTVLTLFLTQRVLAIRSWGRLPLVVWLVFAIYTDSYVFVFATAMLQHSFGVNSNLRTCDSAILLCLVCYVTTKILLYLFLVEKAHIIRGTPKRRIRSKMYLFNSFGMLGVYVIVVLLNFIFRIAKMDNGTCIIGMRSLAMIPLISFDTVVNVYLTIMFLIPLRKLYSFRNMPRNPANMRLRTIAFRTFCGAVFTLVSSIVNLSVLMALNGEPGWVCLMCCNCDILFSAVVIQWVTSRDNAGTSSTTSSGAAIARRDALGPGSIRAATPCGFRSTAPPSTVADTSLVSTAQSSPYRGYATDGPPADPRHPSGVVVTTTIRHESKPGGQVFDLTDLGEGMGAAGPGAGARPTSSRTSCGFLSPESFSNPRTNIMGGRPHQNAKYYGQHSSC